MPSQERTSQPTADQVAAALGGDLAALCDLAEIWRPYLKAVAAEVLGDGLAGKVDPSDTVQGAVLMAVQQFSQFEGESLEELRAWLIAIVRNEARQTQRYWRRQRRTVARELSISPDSESGPEPIDDKSSVGHQSMRHERATRLFAAIERLAADDREVISLRHFSGLAHAEIAARMGRSEAAVRQLWIGALRRLRRELGEST
jgi:RNA polymerase sigma-70 factor (ECF subfamily)